MPAHHPGGRAASGRRDRRADGRLHERSATPASSLSPDGEPTAPPRPGDSSASGREGAGTVDPALADPTVTRVLHRLERLERENRLYRRIGVLVVVLVGAAFWMGQSPSRRTIEAEGIVLRDEDGKVRMALGKKREGGWGIVMVDPSGIVRTTLDMNEEGVPSLEMSDATDHDRLGLSLSADGRPILAMRDEEGEVRAIVGLRARAACPPSRSTTTRDAPAPGSRSRRTVCRGSTSATEKGTVRSALGLDAAGEPMLDMSDAEGRARLQLMLGASGRPRLARLRREERDTRGARRSPRTAFRGSRSPTPAVSCASGWA